MKNDWSVSKQLLGPKELLVLNCSVYQLVGAQLAKNKWSVCEKPL